MPARTDETGRAFGPPRSFKRGDDTGAVQVSRYELEPLVGAGRITGAAVVWDRPLQTFFAQVFARSEDEPDENDHHLGGSEPGELSSRIRRYNARDE
ncbi:hypothetical protein BV98_002281 [Sphingobium herbicidovorans NBRC 16415]|uniref:Uncharacterized protein n=1 Tax=Sphingobium herbicidovorans (strain ATCC 700291 / DSM 11019 / CCUG 56400 / KCTC 2939 / LMG 18315 / NBRC 16415 / MH) TaxID=1219045 RepID=A0A086P9B7_SPHHM|nr:hypothetical protein BV98_002281 [Sphingobium herbicidovorans NBRC 16415]